MDHYITFGGRSFSANKTIVTLVVLIIVSGGAFLLGSVAGQSSQMAKDRNMQDQAIKEVFSGIELGGAMAGKVISVSSDGKSLEVKVPGVFGMNLPQAYQTKTLLIDENTQMTLREEKTAEEFTAELAQARAKTKGNEENFNPPMPYRERTFTLSELNPGADIRFSIDVSQNKGLLDSEYKAVQISVGQI